MKELGKELSKNFLKKVANNMFITYHGQDRLKERTNLCGETLQKTLENVNKAIRNCAYAYNNNDNSISVVLENGQTMVLDFDDNYKKWHFITIKDISQNGYSAKDKHEMAKVKTLKKYKNRRVEKMTDYNKEKRFKTKKPYKRDKAWKGEY